MRYSILIFLTFILGCGQKDDRTAIRIISVDVDITTIISIDCNKFLDSFDSAEYKVNDLKDKALIADFNKELKNLRQATAKHYPDTRALIILNDGISTDTLCADRFTIRYKSKFYTMTDNLLKVIWID